MYSIARNSLPNLSFRRRFFILKKSVNGNCPLNKQTWPLKTHFLWTGPQCSPSGKPKYKKQFLRKKNLFSSKYFNNNHEYKRNKKFFIWWKNFLINMYIFQKEEEEKLKKKSFLQNLCFSFEDIEMKKRFHLGWVTYFKTLAQSLLFTLLENNLKFSIYWKM